MAWKRKSLVYVSKTKGIVIHYNITKNIYSLLFFKSKTMVHEDPDIAPYLESTNKPSNSNNNNNPDQPAKPDSVSQPDTTPQPEAVSQPENVSKDNQQVVAEPNIDVSLFNKKVYHLVLVLYMT